MELQWDLLLNDDSRFPRLLFFGEFSDERFRYGINAHLHYCLYFYFNDSAVNVPVDPVLRANISLEETTDNGRAVLVMTLLNDNIRNLFSDLIISIVTQTRLVETGIAKARFIAICNEWFDFFEPVSGQLSLPELQGIFAELYFLRYLLTTSKLPFNDLLSAWKGPYGKGHDFELKDIHFEIKGITDARSSVTISSEYQLDFLNGQHLFLGVFEFSSNTSSAATLSSLVGNIISILRSATGTRMNLFWSPLGKTGLSPQGLEQYDHHQFSITQMTWYNCCQEGFPALTRSGLPDAIQSVRYEIALNNIREFATKDITQHI